MSISEEGLDVINWWLHHVQPSPNPIRMGEPNTTVTTEASFEGWGAHSHQVAPKWNWSCQCARASGHFTGLFFIPQHHIRILTDMAMAYIHNMGALDQNHAMLIWQWAQKREIWLSHTHTWQVKHNSRQKEQALPWPPRMEIKYTNLQNCLQRMWYTRRRYLCSSKQQKTQQICLMAAWTRGTSIG